MKFRCQRHGHCKIKDKNNIYPYDYICHFCFEKDKRCDWLQTDKYHFNELRDEWVNHKGETKEYNPFQHIHSGHGWRNNHWANQHHHLRNPHWMDNQHISNNERCKINQVKVKEIRRQSKSDRRREKKIAKLLEQQSNRNTNNHHMVEYTPNPDFHNFFHLDTNYIA